MKIKRANRNYKKILKRKKLENKELLVTKF